MNAFKQFIYSLYSPKIIATFRNQRFRKTFLYVLLLVFIAFLPTAAQIYSTLSTVVNEIKDTIENDIQQFEVKNGRLTSEVQAPILIEVGPYIVVFDTTGTYKVSDAEQYDEAVLFLEEGVVTITQGQTFPTPYADILKQEFTEETILSYLGSFPLMISIVLLIIYALFTGLILIAASFLSLIGQYAKKTFKLELSFKQIFVLSVYTLTLPTIFFSLTSTLGISIPFWFGLYWMVAIVLLYTTFKEVRLLEKTIKMS